MHYTTSHAIADLLSVLTSLHAHDTEDPRLVRVRNFVHGQQPLQQEQKPSALSEEDLRQLRISTRGFTREKLASYGIAWPPPKGWRKKLLRGQPL